MLINYFIDLSRFSLDLFNFLYSVKFSLKKNYLLNIKFELNLIYFNSLNISALFSKVNNLYSFKNF
jgi:hypothetical protein